MEDPVLNRNLAEIRELQTRWSQFHDFVTMAMQQGLSKITAQAEMKFLELKSRIAMLHDGFMGGVKSDVKTAQNIIQIVGDAILLRKVAGSSDAERQKFEFDWNECFMLLTETISSLEQEQKRLAAINERSHKAAQRREIMKAQLHNFLHGAGFKWSVTIFTILFVTAGLPLLNIYKWTELYVHPPFGMTFTKNIYMNIVGSVWRPFIDKEYEFLDYDEVKINPAPTSIPNAEAGNAKIVTDKNFVSTALGGWLGMSAADRAEATKLFDGRKNAAIQIEAQKLNGIDVVFIPILFTTTNDAKKFCELCKTAVSKASDKTKVTGANALGRKANLVVFSHGTGAHRTTYIGDKWYIADMKSELE